MPHFGAVDKVRAKPTRKTKKQSNLAKTKCMELIPFTLSFVLDSKQR